MEQFYSQHEMYESLYEKGEIKLRFGNGNWMNREGVIIHSPKQVHDVQQDASSLTLYAPCKYVGNRGATLDGPLLTIRYSSPCENVIRVQIAHFTGGDVKGPAFAIHESSPSVTTLDTPEWTSLISGEVEVRIRKQGNWSVEFLHGGQVLTHSGMNGIGYVQEAGVGVFMREQLNISVGELVYGLGERFTPFIKNGQSIDIWNEDGGTSSEQSYKNIPFYMTNKGYGVFVNHPERVSYEIGSETVSKVQFSVPGELLDYYFILGPSPKEVVQRYTTLTGKPSLPPAWSFGLWLSTSFTTNYDEKTVSHFIDGMHECHVPLHVFHFDCFWMKEYEWTNFTWDDRVFPDPQGMLRRLHEKGMHICVWINPYIAQKSPLFEEGRIHGYLLKRPNGDVWQWDMWQAGMGLVDFTNPHARKWFSGYLKKLMEMGVDSFKTDFGERIPVDVVYYDGSDPLKMHNYYTYLYNQVVFETTQEVLGRQNALVFARSATVGSQQFPVHWGGDCAASYESMAESLRGGLSLSLAGFGFWSHDIGGFEHTATADLYKRWTAFGLLSTHSRLHGSSSYRVPWAFDEEAVDVLRYFTNLKCSLMPYIYAVSCESVESGVAVMRPMVLEFPHDLQAQQLDRQYMLGDALLVAPVFADNGKTSYYLPDGRWTHFISGEVVSGATWRQEQYDYYSLPLFARPNSLIPVGSQQDRPDYAYTDSVVFHLFELADGHTATSTVRQENTSEYLTVTVKRDGKVAHVLATGKVGRWHLLLRGVEGVKDLDGAIAEVLTSGLQVTPVEDSVSITIEFY